MTNVLDYVLVKKITWVAGRSSVLHCVVLQSPYVHQRIERKYAFLLVPLIVNAPVNTFFAVNQVRALVNSKGL